MFMLQHLLASGSRSCVDICNSQNCSMFPLAFVAGDYRVTDEALLAETT